jgi:hypothetical protein
MHVVSKLEILGKVQGVRRGHVAVRLLEPQVSANSHDVTKFNLEVVHSYGVPWEPQPAEKFCQNVQRHLHIGD